MQYVQQTPQSICVLWCVEDRQRVSNEPIESREERLAVRAGANRREKTMYEKNRRTDMPHAGVTVAQKRVYEEPEPGDGTRVLVDRLWPRGLSKERAQVDLWLKDVAPSRELRIWFGHDPAKFAEFRRRYKAELAVDPGRAALTELRALARKQHVTLVFAAHDTEHCNAVVLRELLAQPS